MKIIPFLLRQIQSHKIKSISFVFVILLTLFLGYGIIWMYQNMSSAVSYYSSINIGDPKRVKISSGGNIFAFLSKGVSGLSDETLKKISNDSRFEDIKTFTLIQYPVTGDFSIFSFGLESDIPVFAISGDTPLGKKGVGISQKMLEYYNLQFAGSLPIFPKIDKKFIKGRKVVITVGKSKLFNLDGKKPAKPIETQITDISPDYPGFGVVLPKKILESRLKSIGLSLGNPFKVVAKIKNLNNIENLKKDYKGLNITFDQDAIKENEKRLQTLQLIFGATFLAIICVVGTIILFLLGSILREIKHIYRLIYRLGIFNLRSIFLTLGELIFLTCIAGIIGYFLNIFIFSYFSKLATAFFPTQGILFPIIVPNTIQLFFYIATCIVMLISILFYYNQSQFKELKKCK
ncbi:hypothetical protein KGV55_00225 [Candidatus Gracilibacteria bacterium]|nr:hypothetical protein [Candidatus Gracilibacteria bacterium]MBS9783758.1 hypothetical protein [Candidatus Gracilibacteria bacterium]